MLAFAASKFRWTRAWLPLHLMLVALETGCAHHAASVPSATSPPGIRVLGEGEVLLQPDVANVRLGVESRAATAPDAMQNANETMRAVTEAIGRHGVAAADIQTAEFSVHFERDRSVEREQEARSLELRPAPKAAQGSTALKPREPSGWFVVRNTVVLTLRDINKLGAILGDAMQAGANNIHGLQMTLDDAEAARSEARRKAVLAARRKAEELASAAGLRVGEVLEVVEVGAQPVPYFERMQDHSRAMLSNVPVESGSIQVNATLQVLFAIER